MPEKFTLIVSDEYSGNCPAKRIWWLASAQYPPANGDNQSSFFCNWDELTGSSSPRSGCCQRTSASKPVILPLVRALQLQRRQSLGMHGFIEVTSNAPLCLRLVWYICMSSLFCFHLCLGFIEAACCWRNLPYCPIPSMPYSSLKAFCNRCRFGRQFFLQVSSAR